MKQTIMILIFAFVASCAARVTPIPQPGSPDAQVYSERCGSCHSLPHPRRHTLAGWEHMLTVMAREMEHKGMKKLAEDDQLAIKRYLKKYSR